MCDSFDEWTCPVAKKKVAVFHAGIGEEMWFLTSGGPILKFLMDFYSFHWKFDTPAARQSHKFYDAVGIVGRWGLFSSSRVCFIFICHPGTCKYAIFIKCSKTLHYMRDLCVLVKRESQIVEVTLGISQTVKWPEVILKVNKVGVAGIRQPDHLVF